MPSPLAFLQTHRTAALAGGGGLVVLFGLHQRRKNTGGASSDGGNTTTPPVTRGGVATYDSSGTDYANALSDVSTQLGYLNAGVANLQNVLDPATHQPTAPAKPVTSTPKPKPTPAKPKPKPKPVPPKKPRPRPKPGPGARPIRRGQQPPTRGRL